MRYERLNAFLASHGLTFGYGWRLPGTMTNVITTFTTNLVSWNLPVKLNKTILIVALLGAVSTPVMAHRFDAQLDKVRMSLDVQGERLTELACNTNNMNMCATRSGVDLALDLLRDIPTEASDAEIEKSVRRASQAIRLVTDHHAMSGQYDGLTDSQKVQADTILTEVIHQDGWMLEVLSDIKIGRGE